MNDVEDSTSISDNENIMETYIEVYNKSDRSSKRRSAIRPFVKVKPVGKCYNCNNKETDFICSVCSMFTCDKCKINNVCIGCNEPKSQCCVIS
tara:strand:- start:1137 stop:1415 length:279 start_codon:yes stop_codon:yes gene_type:complete